MLEDHAQLKPLFPEKVPSIVVHMRGKVAFHLNFLPSPIIYKLNHILSEAYQINDKINVKM